MKFEDPDPAARAGSQDAPLFRLAARVRVAEQALQAAMDELAQAEQRLSEEVTQRPRSRRPAWYVAAAAKEEEEAGAALEMVYQQIAQTPAHTKAGLAIKLQLMAMLYGEDEAADETDMVSILLSSLITDVTEN